MQPGQLDVGLPDPERRRFWVRFWLLMGGAVLAVALLIGLAFATGLLKVFAHSTTPQRMWSEQPPAPPPVPTLDDQGRSVTNVEWRERPKPYYPNKAQQAGVEAGSATLSCAASPEGRLGPCEIVEETPPGMGFGDAAAKASLEARVYPSTIDGVPQSGRMRFTVRFRLQ